MVYLSNQEIRAENDEGHAKYKLEGDTIIIKELFIDKEFRGEKQGYKFIEDFADEMKDEYDKIKIELGPQSVDNLSSYNYLKEYLADRILDESTIIINI